MSSTKETGKISRRRLANGDYLSITTVQKENHNFYYVLGKENFILVLVKVLEFLEKNKIPTILQDRLEKDYFLAKKHLPLLIETSTNKNLQTDFLIYKKKKKYLLQPHFESFYGLYDQEIYLDEEIDLKIFFREDWEKTLERMKNLSQTIFSLLKEKLGKISKLELEFSFERTFRYESLLKVTSFELMISDFDIQLEDQENISHKKGKDSEDNERLNKNLLELLNKKIL